MKDFLKFTFASVIGVILAGVVFTILGIITLVGIVASSDTETMVKDNSIFVLDFKGSLSERVQENSLQQLLGEEFEAYGLDDILASIKKAKDNDKIKGIYIQPSYLEASYASLEEIRNALLDFKESGKFIVAYADQYAQKMYYLSSVADKIIINPQGSIGWHGAGMQPVFFKNLVSKLGLEIQVFRVGTYKSAVEPFIATEMSPTNREQMTECLESVWNRIHLLCFLLHLAAAQMHQRQLAFLADGALFRCVVGQIQLEGACHDGNGRRSLGLGAVHHAGNAHADTAVLLNDPLGLQRGDAGGDHVLSDEALLTRMDGEALQGHHIVHALGEDGALAGLAGQLVGIDDAAHGRSHDHIHVHFLDFICHALHDLGAAVGVLLQISHLAVCAGMAAGGQQEVAFQERVTALQDLKCFTHCTSPSLL